jgi:hypothetical protein
MIHEQLALGNRINRDLIDLRRTAVALAVALLALNILDVVATTLIVERLGAVEVNPVMARLIGTPWAATLKIAIPIGVIALAGRVQTRFAVNSLRVAVALYLCVTILLIGQVAYALA